MYQKDFSIKVALYDLWGHNSFYGKFGSSIKQIIYWSKSEILVKIISFLSLKQVQKI